jgi:hypothetical protein
MEVSSPVTADKRIKVRCRTKRVLVDDGEKLILKMAFVLCDKEGESQVSMNDRLRTTENFMSLYGDCCREMTCPLIVFTIFVTKRNGQTFGYNSYNLVSIERAASPSFKFAKSSIALTSSFKKTIIESEYFMGDKKKLKEKGPSVSRSRSTEISLELESISRDDCVDEARIPFLKNKETIYVTRNMFRSEDFFLILNHLGRNVANELTDKEIITSCGIIIYNKNIPPSIKNDTNALFEKMCFCGKIKGVPLNRSVLDFFVAPVHIYDASVLYHKAFDVLNKYCDTYYEETPSSRWNHAAINYLSVARKDIIVWQNTSNGMHILEATEIYNYAKKLSGILCKMSSVNIVQCGIDDGNGISSIDYFKRMADIVNYEENNGNKVSIVTGSNHRDIYIKSMMFDTMEKHIYGVGNAFDKRTASGYDCLIVDRSHAIGTRLLSCLLSHFGSKLTKIYMFGTKEIHPVESGCPFSVISDWNGSSVVESGEEEDEERGQRMIRKDKICKYFDTFNECLDYLYKNTLQKKFRAIFKCFEAYQLGLTSASKRSLVTTNENSTTTEDNSLKRKKFVLSETKTLSLLKDLTFSEEPKSITVIHIEDMNMADLVKCFQCSSTSANSVVIIGTEKDLDQCMEEKNYYKRRDSLAYHLPSKIRRRQEIS